MEEEAQHAREDQTRVNEEEHLCCNGGAGDELMFQLTASLQARIPFQMSCKNSFGMYKALGKKICVVLHQDICKIFYMYHSTLI